MIDIKYPTFKTRGRPTPSEYLVICHHCGHAVWAIYTKNLSIYCVKCHSRMREGTPEEYTAAKLVLEKVI